MPTLAEYLKIAGVQVAPAKTAAKKEPATAPETPPAPPAGACNGKNPAEPAGGKKPQEPNEPPTQDTGERKKAMIDPVFLQTEEQRWLASNGVFIGDTKVASIVYAQQAAAYEQAKTAEVEKLATELRSQGALMYHGMLNESTAMRMADGQATIQDACKTAAWTGVDVASIIKRAELLQAAMPHPALVDGQLGAAARPSSRAQQAAETSRNTVEFEPEAAAGTRQPVVGQDEKLTRFTDVMTLPGNPGLNHGMSVDQGRGA